MIEEGTSVLLAGESGERHLLRTRRDMIDVRGLGVVDGGAVCDGSFGGTVTIAGRQFKLVKPSIRDLLSSIDRKAQIILAKDSFPIPMFLDIGCGSRVIEAGAGSGAMTLVLLRAVAPDGIVYTYERREDLASVARKNVLRSGLAECWRLSIADVCSDIRETEVDAAMLDIPEPWDALEGVLRALRTGGHVCCYIPNMNQLETTANALGELGFVDILCLEILQREMNVHRKGVRPSSEMMGHTGYLAFGRKL
ncbi:MAG: tRNA (adenine-N1)-methyltransferase [Methanobacteriota archaeon]|nr:MAG: tRNA (adenine-N1)-methyltransferase [Euryarchaeota archaeon]